jgi:hypothetical protein
MAESVPRKGGGREIVSIDLLEISATSTPMHPDTRALSWKAVFADAIPSEADQRRRLASLLLTAEQERDIASLCKVLAEDEPSAPQRKASRPVQVARYPC